MKSARYIVLLYSNAESDIADTIDYIENHLKVSPNQLLDKILKCIDILSDNPFIYPLVKDPFLSSLGYRMIPIDNYLLFYTVIDAEVQIHRSIYGKRNYGLFF
jgi:plasmid stabilization system protein ParE